MRREVSCPEVEALAARLAEPLPGDSPVGDDPRGIAELDYLRAEVARDSGRDWERMAEVARGVLGSKAKDLSVLGYLLLAGTVSRGWKEGAAAALALSSLAGERWDDVHPRRDRARENAFRWLADDRTVGTLARVPAGGADLPALEAFLGAVEALRELLARRFPDSPPSLKALSALLEAKAGEASAAAGPAVAAQGCPASREMEAAPPSAVPARNPPPDPVPAAPAASASKGDLQVALQKLALSWWSADPGSPMGYKLLRACRWQELTSAPKSDGGRTSLPPPNPARVAHLEGRYAAKDWAALLEKCEPAFTEPGLHLWLDLQHWVSEALQAVGRTACAEVVRSELAELLGRVPGLAELRYGDGTPFASARTREWIGRILRDPEAVPARSAAAREDSLSADVEAARALLDEGKGAEALELIQSGLAFGDGRSRALRLLEFAKISLLAGKIRPALAVAGELVERTVRMDLAHWDPALQREILEVRLEALGAALDAKIGDPSRLREAREEAARMAAASNPALLARFDFQ